MCSVSFLMEGKSWNARTAMEELLRKGSTLCDQYWDWANGRVD